MLLVPTPVIFTQESPLPEKELSYTKFHLEVIIFDLCADCRKVKMASVPQGAYAARKVHSNMSKSLAHDPTVLVTKKRDSERNIPPHYHFPQANKQFLDHPPAKYNSKMMNSIWGLYNRYSVHNLKKITDGDKTSCLGEQQLTAAAPRAFQSGTTKADPQPMVVVSWEALSYGHTY